MLSTNQSRFRRSHGTVIFFSLLFTFCFSLFTNSASAQNLDSLWTVWEDETQPETTRLKAMQKIAWDGYLYSQPDSAFYFAQLQYDFAKSKGLKQPMADALNTQGGSFYVRGNYPKALEYYQKGLAMQEELGNKKGIAGTLNNIGLIHQTQGNYPQALEYHQKSLAIKEELGNKQGIAASQNNIGNIYVNQGNYPQALVYYQKSLAMQEELGNKQGTAGCLNNIGIIYRQQANYPQALEYSQKSLALREELGNKQGIAGCLNNIGIIYRQQANYPQALDYYQKSLAICEELGDIEGIATSLINIGTIYQAQGNYPQALEYCKKSFELAESLGVLVRQKEACQCLYDTYKAMGKGNEALVYLEKLNAVNDSLQAEETNKKLQQMEFAKQVFQDSVETHERERQVELAHQEEVRKKNQSRNWSIAGGVFALLLAGGYYSRWRYVRKSRDIISKEKDRSENLLLNILPAEIAEELKEKGKADARDFEMVSILFTDFADFTEQSSKMSAADLVNEINHCFEAFDGIMEKHGIEKIKTIGDAYMAAGGLPVPGKDSVQKTVLAALEMQDFIEDRRKTKDERLEPAFRMRVGIHTGPVVAGIVGVKKFQYDVWGDTVNTASRVESAGEVGKVNISRATYELLVGPSTSSGSDEGSASDPKQFSFESRGKVEVKGKGGIDMYFVSLKA